MSTRSSGSRDAGAAGGRAPRPVDDGHMRAALRLAARGEGSTSPNPVVGAVVVAPSGAVVGTGYHERAGGPHAEVRALDAAGPHAAGGTLYCTLEPCCHQGRTGPCVARIVAARIARVVVAMRDPNPRVDGGGIAALRRHGVTVEVGLRGGEAARLNAPFVTWISEGRPLVTMKIAASLDGRIARRVDERTVLTSTAAHQLVHRQRATVDAVAVGSTTVLVDDPRLTARGPGRQRPLTRVVFDRRLRMPPTARVLGTVTEGPVVVMTVPPSARCGPDPDLPAAARQQERIDRLSRAGAIVEVLPDDGFLRDALRRLAARGILHVVVEGGRDLHEAFWRERLVDRVQMFVAPVTLGPAGVAWLNGAEVVGELATFRVAACGPDLLMEGDVHRTH